MRIAVDAMGGDHAPEVIIEGAIQSAQDKNVEIILVGKTEQIQRRFSRLNLSIVEASQVIEMGEEPAKACLSKRDSSICKGLQIVRDGIAEAFVSAGNSGAVVTGAVLILGLIPGILRPGILVTMPVRGGNCVLIDAGANVDCRPEHFLQFAMMASIYAKYVQKKPAPKVGLLNIGTEIGKGNRLLMASYELLEQNKSLNFIGNVEGNEILLGKTDVVVCNGFVGNVLLKFAESCGQSFVEILKKEISQGELGSFQGSRHLNVGYKILGEWFKKVSKKFHYAEYGGAPLLGVKGTCVIAHGSSDAVAIKNAIWLAKDLVEQGIAETIAKALT